MVKLSEYIVTGQTDSSFVRQNYVFEENAIEFAKSLHDMGFDVVVEKNGDIFTSYKNESDDDNES